MTTTNLHAASNQWASRPADERFLTLADLHRFVARRTELSRAVPVSYRDLRVAVTADGDLRLKANELHAPHEFTHFSFDTLCTYTSIPAGFLRKLADSGEPQLVAEIFNNRLAKGDTWAKPTMSAYVAEQDNPADGGAYLRTITALRYGRIYDQQVVEAVQDLNSDGRWSVPLGAYGGVNSLEATTLYAGDRDIFLFMVDETRPIEVGGQTFFRGFYTYNSEHGDKKYGLSTFLYEYVCANRIIWGARDVRHLTIKHTDGAPARFLAEARPMLKTMAEASDRPVIEALTAARNTKVAESTDGAIEWLQAKGFNNRESAGAVALALTGTAGTTGDPTSLLSLVEAGTAIARDVPNTDERLIKEAKWSRLMAGNKAVAFA